MMTSTDIMIDNIVKGLIDHPKMGPISSHSLIPLLEEIYTSAVISDAKKEEYKKMIREILNGALVCGEAMK